jgi:hypothetical protein
VKSLTLWKCDVLIHFPATLIHLKSLKMMYYQSLVWFPVFLPSLQVLDIVGCNKLPVLKIFGERHCPPVNYVMISRCNALKEIQISRRITSLTIRDCQNLKDISGKEFVSIIKQS